MKCFATIALLICATVARCEPPPPQSQYLPPHQQQQQVQQPSNNYLPPTQSYQAPSSNYLAPQRSHSAPSSNYGAPAVTGAIFPKQGGGGGGIGGYGGSNNGYGRGDENYGPAKYEFKYDVQDYESGNDFGHMESRDGDLTVGRYYVLLPDGRKQVVDYEADQNGYRPSISYEQTNNGINGGGRNGGNNYANNGGGYDNNAQSNKFGGYQ